MIFADELTSFPQFAEPTFDVPMRQNRQPLVASESRADRILLWELGPENRLRQKIALEYRPQQALPPITSLKDVFDWAIIIAIPLHPFAGLGSACTRTVRVMISDPLPQFVAFVQLVKLSVKEYRGKTTKRMCRYDLGKLREETRPSHLVSFPVLIHLSRSGKFVHVEVWNFLLCEQQTPIGIEAFPPVNGRNITRYHRARIGQSHH